MKDEQEPGPVMLRETRFRLVLITAPDGDVAGQLARGLLKAELAACVNLLPGIQSVFRWQGQVEESTEVLMIVKTLVTKIADLAAWVKREHPYDVPEIISLNLAEVEGAYGRWLAGELES
jgi:periplasmic divalent cation tolerance protein